MACVKRRAACGASYNACASGATPCKFETRQPARPAGKRGRTVNFNAELGGREEACSIAHNDWIHCYESQLMFNGLAYQHSIERILVILRQSRKTRNGSFVERERLDAVNVTLFY